MAGGIKFVSMVLLSSSFGLVFSVVHTHADYCSTDTLENSGNGLEFAKEPNSREFAIRGKVKSLHCCANGYRSIVWSKDGKPYPWTNKVSKFNVYPEHANQTIWANGVTLDDAGNYTCYLSNDTLIRTHVIELKIFEKAPVAPQMTYITENVQAAVHHKVRLFCEAFAGSVDLPDAVNDVVWRKSGHHNSSSIQKSHITQKKVAREDNQTFGTYLVFDGIKSSDFGEYVCEIIIPGNRSMHRVVLSEKKEDAIVYINPNPFPVRNMLLIASAIIFLVLVVFVLNMQYGLPMRVRFKDSFGVLENSDGKQNDVIVLYARNDSDLAMGVLVPTLESKYSYKCAAQQLSPNVSAWFGTVQGDALKSRRVIALISPALLNDKWHSSEVYQAIKQLQAMGPKLTCVLLSPLPNEGRQIKNVQGESLNSLLRTIHVIQWEHSCDDKFWLALRLRLPPKREYFSQEEASRMASPSTSTEERQSFDDLV